MSWISREYKLENVFWQIWQNMATTNSGVISFSSRSQGWVKLLECLSKVFDVVSSLRFSWWRFFTSTLDSSLSSSSVSSFWSSSVSSFCSSLVTSFRSSSSTSNSSLSSSSVSSFWSSWVSSFWSSSVTSFWSSWQTMCLFSSSPVLSFLSHCTCTCLYTLWPGQKCCLCNRYNRFYWELQRYMFDIRLSFA